MHLAAFREASKPGSHLESQYTCAATCAATLACSRAANCTARDETQKSEDDKIQGNEDFGPDGESFPAEAPCTCAWSFRGRPTFFLASILSDQLLYSYKPGSIFKPGFAQLLEQLVIETAVQVLLGVRSLATCPPFRFSEPLMCSFPFQNLCRDEQSLI